MPDRARIQFLYTGGTLGMVGSPRGLEPGADVRGEIAALLRDSGLDVSSGFSEFHRTIDSSNVTPADWQQMVDHLRRHRDEHDGFVVLHGTNTLAHSAAAVSYALTDFGKPVVFTGAQVPFGMAGSDAPGNVLGAVEAVISGAFASVALFFDGVLLAGARATKVSALDMRGFASPHAEPLEWRSGSVREEPDPLARPQVWKNPLPYRGHDIAVITAVPGMSAERFRAMTTPRPSAVIFRTYGAGEGPGEAEGLPEAVGELVSGGTPVVVVSQSLRARVDLGRYAAGEFLRGAGAIGAEDMTFEAVYTKLMFLLSQGVDGQHMEKWLLTDLAGEVSAPRPAR
ncbi:asparaginase [Streptomyces sp. NPDC097640]|uniref:asparaginase n=1 Tax=Streptomyces sp. NPDC097640 TaxID=3157229 RepID=UPI0033296DA3